ncbi:MAG: oxidoreductase [Massilia sp.]|nr:oxidoreductase [Massilia sp.]
MARTLNIIGAGHLGRTLGRLFAASGAFAVQDVLTRSEASARDAIAFIGAGRAAASLDQMRAADAVMLAVGDDQIEAVCAALAAAGALDGVLVFHCSGAKSSAVLRAAIDKGALTASVHPVRSFADPAEVARDFAGTWCGVEGDSRALALLEPALAAIGARTVAIDPAAKTVYHAASVFASNYLVTVLDAALRAYQAAGIPEQVARELARPLATETLENVFRLGPRAALSGPIARGDHATVARQQAALDGWDGATGQLYRALAEATTGLASLPNTPKKT